jgi:hypothetical protein
MLAINLEEKALPKHLWLVSRSRGRLGVKSDSWPDRRT